MCLTKIKSKFVFYVNTLPVAGSTQSRFFSKKACLHLNCITAEVVKKLTSVGFEPTPTKTTALTLRLRPLGHDVLRLFEK